MPLKFSEMIALRVDLAHNLEAGFTHYLEEIAGGYGDFVTSLLQDGETAPEIGFHVELLKRGVERGRERLQSFNEGIVEQTHEDAKVRAEIDRHHKAVDGKLRQVRHLCRGFYGSEGVSRIGLQEDPPEGSSRLHEQGVTVKASLLKPDLGLEPMIEIEVGDGVARPEEQMAAQLEPELSELGALLADRHQENRKSADLRSRRRRAIEEFDREVRAIVRMAQGIFRLAGREELADRFRPILRRITRRLKKDDEASESGSEASSEPASTASTTEETAQEATA